VALDTKNAQRIGWLEVGTGVSVFLSCIAVWLLTENTWVLLPSLLPVFLAVRGNEWIQGAREARGLDRIL